MYRTLPGASFGKLSPMMDRPIDGGNHVTGADNRPAASTWVDEIIASIRGKRVILIRSQSVTLKTGRGHHRKYRPYAFTEQGIAMLSSVLKSARAVQVNIEIMRAFVRLRELIATNKELARRLDALEKRYDAQFKVVFDAIRQVMAPPGKAPRSIGFRVEEARPVYKRPRRRRGVVA